MQVTRRGLVTGAALGGGLLVAWWVVPRRFPNPLLPAEGEHAFDAWLKIAEDGVVTVAVPQLEMGQGITTLIPQIIANELGADWRQIAVEPAAISGVYANTALARRWLPLWDPGSDGEVDEAAAARFAETERLSATADGTSLAAYEEPCRIAAASARAMLAMEAAERWGASWEECDVADGFVSLGDNRASFGELAAGAAGQSAPDPAPLRPEPPSDDVLPSLTASGEREPPTFARLDLPSKVDGSHQFAGDVRLPGMLYASIRHGPNHGSEMTGYNAEGAKGVRGLKRIVESQSWLAVVADTWWSANEALKKMQPQFDTAYPVESADISERLDSFVREGSSFRIAETGFGMEGFERVDMARQYDVEPASAAPLETASATARYRDGRLELWMAAQAPEQARRAAARTLDIAVEDVVLYPMPAGGSFDARLEHDHAIEIALIAREAGAPVQLTWPRRSELLRSRPRAPASILIGAQLTQQSGGVAGAIDALRMRIACPPSALEFGARLFREATPAAAIKGSAGRKDPLACEGAVPPYKLPSLVVDHVPVEIGLPTGRVRGNAHSYTAFAIESFLDEVAFANGREPLSYRVAMLGEDIRMAACLQRAAQLAGWNGGADNSGQGLACHRIGDPVTGARIACVATARPDVGSDGGGVRVVKLSVAVDIGRIINRDIARQQIEGGLIFGMGIALGAAPRWRGGLPSSVRYDDLRLPALNDCPEIEVSFIASENPPADPGELGAVVAPPAIANALFSATGLRLRRLPLLSDGL